MNKNLKHILGSTFALTVALGAVTGLVACDGNTDSNNSSENNSIVLEAATKTVEEWDVLEMNDYKTADNAVKNNTVKYQLIGSKNHYFGAYVYCTLNLYTDGFIKEEVYMRVGTSDAGTWIPMYHYGYWYLEDSEISTVMLYTSTFGEWSELAASNTVALDSSGQTISGQAVYNIFTFGQDYCPVTGTKTIKYPVMETDTVVGEGESAVTTLCAFHKWAQEDWDATYKAELVEHEKNPGEA